MQSFEEEETPKTLDMKNEDHYRKKEQSYRTSDTYERMTSLYPILQSSIKDCENESLIT